MQQLMNHKSTEKIFKKYIRGKDPVEPLPKSADFYIPTLVFLSGPLRGREVPLLHPKIILGRGKNCDVIIPDPTISRKHLQISTEEIVNNEKDKKYNVILKDLDSKNGVVINYSRVKEAVLQPGDKIIFGRISFRFEQKPPAGQDSFNAVCQLPTSDNPTSVST
jgi:pSer/pThr/pTyr-binding forkhead associated (FHA) protein